MGLFPLPVETFGGLDLVDAPDEVGFSRAIDLLNVDILPGRIQSRPGFTAVGANAAANIDSIFGDPTSGANQYFLVGTVTPTLQVFNDSGVVQTITKIGGGTATTQSASAAKHNFARFGDTTHEYVYIANGTDQVRRFEPSTLTFTAPAGLSAYATGSNLVGVTPWDNRLVLKGTTNKSRVWFSDPGAPETVGANNFIDLTPGDGEQLVAFQSWRNLFFVFKQTKFFVFYGTSTDSSGNPIFNYRTVDTGFGIDGTSVAYAQRAVAGGPDAVYFVNKRGIYRSAGGPPELMSNIVSGGMNAYWQGGTPAIGIGTDAVHSVALAWGYESMYVGLASINAPLDPIALIFVYDRTHDQWTAYSPPPNLLAFNMAPFFGTRTLLFGSGVTPAYLNSASTTDLGASFASRYQSGFDNIAPPRRFAAHYLFGNTRKRIRKWKLTGTGAVAFNVAHDFNAMVGGSSRNLTLGTSPATKDGWYQVAKRGQLFSYRISDVAGAPWTVQKMTSYLAGAEPPLLGSPADQ